MEKGSRDSSEVTPLIPHGAEETTSSVRSFGYGDSNSSENDIHLTERSSDLLHRVESNGSGSSRWKRISTILRSGSAFNTKMKLIALLSDRERALTHKGVGAAAFLIQEAVLGRMENPAYGKWRKKKKTSHVGSGKIGCVSHGPIVSPLRQQDPMIRTLIEKVCIETHCPSFVEGCVPANLFCSY